MAELLVATVVFVLWIAMFKRMVPLKLYNQMSVGDVVKNKFGTVYRF
ncbi:unnamed protein product [Gongylonema pulchrum]|uniref:DUF4834 domain-containing protein n=1 Tax=Gongylonema pulchrum TaxID=637853 RepID=A0A183DLD1_9BILA|nr:unnamed protein product [Gongylonema pulchrum]